MRFTRVKIENWRNFVNVDVALQRRVFLIGPNASGKSNLLDVFRFLSDVSAVAGGLQWAANTRRGGVSRIRAFAARRNPEIVLSVDVGDDEAPASWRYELRLAQDTRQRAKIRREAVLKGGALLFSRPDEQDTSDEERLTQTHLEQVNVNRPYRELAEFFASVRYLHVVPQLVREPDRSVGRRNDPFGGDFLEQIARTPARTRDARLRKVREALQVAVPQLRELELWRSEQGTPHLRGKYEHWRAQGAWQTEEEFSDGTLRLIGLLWALLDGDGPLLLEEPETSLHPGVVRHLPQMFARIQRRSGRQILVSTHSAELLSDEGIGLDEALLLEPETEGTAVRAAGDFHEVRDLLDGGVPLSEAVLPRTMPRKADQLALFGA